MYYQHFLGIDVLELAPRVSDAAAITAKFEIPTMQASECVVCHKTLDPVAGLFQDYYQLPEALFGPRKEGWFKDMFGPWPRGRRPPAGSALARLAVARRANLQKTRGLPGPWWSTFTTFSPDGRCFSRRLRSMIRSTMQSAAPTTHSAMKWSASRQSLSQTGLI
jgi:hypothetical protein